MPHQTVRPHPPEQPGRGTSTELALRAPRPPCASRLHTAAGTEARSHHALWHPGLLVSTTRGTGTQGPQLSRSQPVPRGTRPPSGATCSPLSPSRVPLLPGPPCYRPPRDRLSDSRGETSCSFVFKSIKQIKSSTGQHPGTLGRRLGKLSPPSGWGPPGPAASPEWTLLQAKLWTWASSRPCSCRWTAGRWPLAQPWRRAATLVPGAACAPGPALVAWLVLGSWVSAKASLKHRPAESRSVHVPGHGHSGPVLLARGPRPLA